MIPQPGGTGGDARISEADWAALRQSASVVEQDGWQTEVVVFTDYHCPWCARLEANLDQVRERSGHRLRVHYRHRPVTALHPGARRAAVLAECAREQQVFPAMHRVLFALGDSTTLLSPDEVAMRAGVGDVQSFAACVADERPAERLATDSAMAEKMGVLGTPVIFLERRRFRGAAPATVIDSLIGLQRRR
jgi:protein-disulfide isomerase